MASVTATQRALLKLASMGEEKHAKRPVDLQEKGPGPETPYYIDDPEHYSTDIDDTLRLYDTDVEPTTTEKDISNIIDQNTPTTSGSTIRANKIQKTQEKLDAAEEELQVFKNKTRLTYEQRTRMHELENETIPLLKEQIKFPNIKGTVELREELAREAEKDQLEALGITQEDENIRREAERILDKYNKMAESGEGASTEILTSEAYFSGLKQQLNSDIQDLWKRLNVLYPGFSKQDVDPKYSIENIGQTQTASHISPPVYTRRGDSFRELDPDTGEAYPYNDPRSKLRGSKKVIRGGKTVRTTPSMASQLVDARKELWNISERARAAGPNDTISVPRRDPVTGKPKDVEITLIEYLKSEMAKLENKHFGTRAGFGDTARGRNMAPEVPGTHRDVGYLDTADETEEPVRTLIEEPLQENVKFSSFTPEERKRYLAQQHPKNPDLKGFLGLPQEDQDLIRVITKIIEDANKKR